MRSASGYGNSVARLSPIVRRGGLVTVGAVIALSGCGGSGGEAAPVQPVGQDKAGSVAPLAQCRDWIRGNPAEQLATIEDIRSQINLEGGTVQAPPLSDEEAQGVFDRACSNEFAKTFRLYVIYSRAAGFAPLMRDR